MKLDSTFFADFLFGVLADREDCKSTMNTTLLAGTYLSSFLSPKPRDVGRLFDFSFT